MSQKTPDAPAAAHPTTAGWGDPEPPPTDFDGPADADPVADAAEPELHTDGPPPPDDTAWGAAEPPPSLLPSIERPEGVARDEAPWPDDSDEEDGWDAPEADRGRAGSAAAAWSELEDEARVLPPGLERLGRVERVRLVGVDVPTLLARLDTGRARSSLHAEVQSANAERVRIRLAGAICDLPRVAGEPADAVWARVTVRIGPAELPLTVRVAAPTDGETLVLGCDLLAGRFVVDPAALFIADIEGPADPDAIARAPDRG